MAIRPVDHDKIPGELDKKQRVQNCLHSESSKSTHTTPPPHNYYCMGTYARASFSSRQKRDESISARDYGVLEGSTTPPSIQRIRVFAYLPLTLHFSSRASSASATERGTPTTTSALLVRRLKRGNACASGPTKRRVKEWETGRWGGENVTHPRPSRMTCRRAIERHQSTCRPQRKVWNKKW